ncbi:hypothetical protein Taro_002878 [Colocasia esculenta]|uniref:DNA-directed RNA polymerase n=1 Tax=Colocasia esculenta TaxID=4460 RepID=A0A843TM78_COLES|nr:hypothetical protein [Colocasia esculenta]
MMHCLIFMGPTFYQRLIHMAEDKVKFRNTGAGYQRWGAERVCNGWTCEMMHCLIFMGPTFYRRLIHMAEDKVKFRNTGPVHPLTRQPMMHCLIFMGLTFYQRLIHMVEDNVKFRNTGLVHPLIRQPVVIGKDLGESSSEKWRGTVYLPMGPLRTFTNAYSHSMTPHRCMFTRHALELRM